MMKYFNNYNTFSRDIEIFDKHLLEKLNQFDKTIDSLDESIVGNLFKRGRAKFKSWAVKAPKVRKLQAKANSERLKSVEVQVEARRIMEESLNDDKDVDIARLKKIMKKKVAIHLKQANAHEEQVDKIIDGNEYLEKVKNVVKYKGEIERNEALMSKATEEEEFELDADNAEFRDQIDIETDDIEQQIKYEKNPDGNEEPVPRAETHIKNKTLSKLEKKGFTDEELRQAGVKIDLWLRRLIKETFAKRGGKQLRKSSSTLYQMINDAMKLVDDGMSLPNASEQIMRKYEKEGKIKKKDRILKDDDED